MSQSTAATTGLTSQYAAQVTSDLERNTEEQERINADITALQEQLASLQHDHAVLVKVQQALGITLPPVQPPATPDSTVPVPRKKASAKPGAGELARTKKEAGDAPGHTVTKKQEAKQSADRSSVGKVSRPTLVELIRRHLTEQSEPRSAAEVATALGQVHPERGIKTTVVRTTLENLVAKSRAQRNKQGSSVYYTAIDAAEQTTASAQEEPKSQQAG